MISPPAGFTKFPLTDIETNIPARFEKQVQLYPNNIALKIDQKRYTYRQINASANRLARAIEHGFINDGKPIGLLFSAGPAMVEAILAVLKLGRIWLPLDPGYPHERLSHILQHAQAGMILTDEATLKLAQQINAGHLPIFNTSHTQAGLSDDNLNRPISADTISHILYTSGSTGRPKGVVHNHRTLLHNIMGHTNSLYISAEDRLSLFPSFSHTAGVTGTFRALFNGASLYPYSIKTQGLDGLAQWMIDQQISLYHSVPTVFRHFCATLTGTESFPQLRLIHLGGETLSSKDVATYKQHFSENCVLLNNLGSTEAPTFRFFFINHQTELSDELVPVGYEVPGKEVLLLDDDGEAVALNEIGEITVKSEFLALGYWQEAEMSEKAFSINPDNPRQRIFRTGDLGRFRADGCLVHLGRKDNQVKVRGHRIELAEVEAALLACEGIKEGVVLAHQNGSGQNSLVAYAVPNKNQTPTNSQLRQQLGRNLPDFMIPATFMRMDALPLLPNGKLNRKALPAIEPTRPDLDVSFIAPTDDPEKALAEIWQDTLNVKPIGIHDNFFDLGGNSLTSAQLVSHIKHKLGYKINLMTLFQAPTIAQLAQALQADEQPGQWSSLTPLQTTGTRPPFFCLPGILGNVYLDLKDLAHFLGNEQPFYGLQDGLDKPSNIKALARLYLNEVQAVQPHGPYYLGGLCAGGVIAFEMAQQLTAQGQTVALLALIEPAPPRKPGLSSYANFVGAVGRRLGGRLRHHSSNIKQLEKDQQQDYLRLKKKLIANLFALRQYAPKTYPHNFHLFLTEHALEIPDNPQRKWQNFSAQRVELHTIPGTHDTITGNNDTPIEAEHIRVLAQQLKDCLDTAIVVEG